MDDNRLPRVGWPSRFAVHISRLTLAPSFFLLPLSFFLLALLFLWPLTLHPGFAPYNPHSAYSDLVISHLPNAEYIRASLARFGQLPWWNAQLFAGQPFAADPLAGMWYPPGWLLLVLPLPFAFNLLFALHLAWAGYGLYVFLRRADLSPGPAFLGGLAFMGTPKLVAHLSAGHVSLVFAVAWTPWLLLAIRRAAVEGGFRRGSVAGACLALIFLADVRWAFYAAVLGLAWWLASLPPFAPRRAAGQVGWTATGMASMFLALSAVLALPLAQFILQSSRGQLTLAEAAAFSLPPQYLLGLLMLDPYGYHEYLTYLGLVPLALAFWGLRQRTLFWGLAVLAAVAFSLGSNFVFFPLLFRLLPGLGFLRVPPRAWFVVAVGACILAAHGAQRLQAEFLAPVRSRGRSPSSFFLSPLPLVLLVLITFGDLLRASTSLLEARPLLEAAPAAKWIASQPGLFRVYSPSNSLPPGDGLLHAEGIDPLQLAAFVSFFEKASGVRVECYTVTLPPLGPCQSNSHAEVATFNAAAAPDARRLGLLNVKYVAAEFPVDAPGLQLVQTFGGTRVYENTQACGAAWVEETPSHAARAAEVVEWSPNRLHMRAEGPGRLVLGEVMYPGWQAWVDATPTPIERVEDLLRGVQLGAGEHDVVFEFRPTWLAIGAAISALGWLALAGLARWAR